MVTKPLKTMANNENENGNSSNANNIDLDVLDHTALKDLYVKERDMRTKTEENNRQLFERAKKAEGFEKQEDGNWVKIERQSPVKEKPKGKSEDQAELDYSQKAFLLAKGIEEFDIVLEEAKKFGGDLKNMKLEDLISNPYFQQKLEAHRTTKANEVAADGISGKGGTGVSGKSTPEYWVAKLGPNDPIPADLSRELREKIVDMRRQKGKDTKMFYND